MADIVTPQVTTNTQIPLGVTPTAVQQTNPLDQISKLATIQNAMNANREFQQVFDARQALGPMYQQATDPKTGKLDTGMLLSLASKDPRTAFMAQDLATHVLTNEHQQLTNAGEKVTLMNNKNTSILGALTSASTDGHYKLADIQDHGTRLVGSSNGAISPQEIGNFITGLPAEGPELDSKMQQYTGQLMSAKDRLDAVQGDIHSAQAGSSVNFFRNNRLSGAVTPLGSYTMGLTPGEAATPHTFKDTNSAEVSATGAQIAAGGTALGTAVPSAPPSTQFIPAQGQGAPALPPGPPTAAAAASGNALMGQPGQGPAPPLPPGSVTGLGTQVAPPGALGPTPKLGTGVTSLTPLEAKARDNFISDEDALNQNVAKLRPVAIAMQTERAALQKAQLGGWAESRGEIAKMLQGARNALPQGAADSILPQTLIDKVGNGSISDTQTFNAAIQPLIMGAFRDSVQGTGRGFMLEYKNQQENYPKTTNDPAQYENISNMFAKGFDQMLREQSERATFRHEMGNGQLNNYVGAKSYADFAPMFSQKLQATGELQFPQIGGAAKGSTNPPLGAQQPRRANATMQKADGDTNYFKIGGKWYPETATVP